MLDYILQNYIVQNIIFVRLYLDHIPVKVQI